MSDRQAPKKGPQIIRAPEIGVISPKTYSSTERWTAVHWNERESTKKQKQLSFSGQFPMGIIFWVAEPNVGTAPYGKIQWCILYHSYFCQHAQLVEVSFIFYINMQNE